MLSACPADFGVIRSFQSCFKIPFGLEVSHGGSVKLVVHEAWLRNEEVTIPSEKKFIIKIHPRHRAYTRVCNVK